VAAPPLNAIAARISWRRENPRLSRSSLTSSRSIIVIAGIPSPDELRGRESSEQEESCSAKQAKSAAKAIGVVFGLQAWQGLGTVAGPRNLSQTILHFLALF